MLLMLQFGEETKLKEFCDFLNCYYPIMKYTLKCTQEKMKLLDIELFNRPCLQKTSEKSKMGLILLNCNQTNKRPSTLEKEGATYGDFYRSYENKNCKTKLSNVRNLPKIEI